MNAIAKPKQNLVCLPYWTDDQKDGPYIEYYICYQQGAELTHNNQLIVRPDEFQKHYNFPQQPKAHVTRGG